MSRGPPATSGNELAPRATPGGPERNQLIAELQREFSTRGLRCRRRTRLVRQISVQTLLQTGGPLKRALDVLLALLVLPFAIPVLLGLYLVALFYGGGIVRRTKLGRLATTFGQYTYDWGDMPAGASLRTSDLTFLPSLLNVISGPMSFIGPCPLTPLEVSAEETSAWKRFDLKPGFISLWWIRKRASIAYLSESVMDAEYVDTHSFWGDLGIALRAVPALLTGGADWGNRIAPRFSESPSITSRSAKR